MDICLNILNALDTPAAKKFKDNVPEKIKQKRLTEIISKQREHSLMHMKKRIGKNSKC